jgi:hypothetical protein
VVTKTELEELVIQAYSTFDKQLLDFDRKPILRAWYEILHDLPYDGAKKAFLRLASVAAYMPKAPEIRREHINSQNLVPQQPSPHIAWGILIGLIKGVNNGTINSSPIPVALQKTIELLGDSVWGFDSYEDQRGFMRVYEEVVTEMQKQIYEIPEAGTQA